MTRIVQGAALLAVGACAIGAAAFTYDHRGYHTPSNTGVVPASAATRALSPAMTTPPRAAAPVGHPARPLRVRIDAIHVSASVVPVSIEAGGALQVPDDPRQLGWWSGGARPGSATGSVVVVGHVDSARLGRGALFHLESVPMGSRVAVTTARGTTTYKVVARRVYPKQALPSGVFATTGPPRLVLITCGGPFNHATQHYADNVVVYAVAV